MKAIDGSPDVHAIASLVVRMIASQVVHMIASLVVHMIASPVVHTSASLLTEHAVAVQAALAVLARALLGHRPLTTDLQSHFSAAALVQPRGSSAVSGLPRGALPLRVVACFPVG